MTIWSPDLSERTGPLYRALADAIGTAIDEGTLGPGDQLPTHRDLSERLGIALTTVTRGYAEAERRGLVQGEVGRGTFVRTRAAWKAGEGEGESGEGIVDLRANSLLPWALSSELLDRMARRINGGDPVTLFGYGPHAGRRTHREAGAAWITRNGLRTSPDQVLVTTGVQHGMAVVFATLTRPGDAVAVGEVTYSGVRSVARVLGIELRPVRLDEEGLDPESVDEVLSDGAVKALYTIPTLQNPTASVMSEERRREVARIAEGRGVPIVDDDSYGFMLPGVRPLSSYTDASYYLVGTSKSLIPSLRVGFIRAPTGMVDRLAAAVAGTVYMTSPLATDLVVDWLQGETADRVVSWKREQIRSRQAAVRSVLRDADYVAHPSSPHGWIRLPEPWTARLFSEQAALRGVRVSPADEFSVGRDAPHAVRICVGPVPSRALLEEAVETLAELLGQGPDAGSVVV